MKQIVSEVNTNRDQHGQWRTNPAAHVRFYGNDWFTGVAGMKADERGVYISMCVHIWTTGRRVPLDDAEAARRLCLQFNLYQRIRNRLLAMGKITRNIDGYGNDRAETELERANDARPETSRTVRSDRRPVAEPSPERRVKHGTEKCAKQGGAQTHSAGGPTPDETAPPNDPLLISRPGTMAGTMAGTLAGTLAGTTRGATIGGDQKTEQNQRPFSEYDKEKKERVSPTPQNATDERVQIVDGRLRLVNGLEAFWLSEFGGDAKRLELALIEALPNINHGSRVPLEAQVGRVLARTVADKRDRDQRYAAAVAAKARQQGTPSGKPTMAEILARRAAAEVAP